MIYPVAISANLLRLLRENQLHQKWHTDIISYRFSNLFGFGYSILSLPISQFIEHKSGF